MTEPYDWNLPRIKPTLQALGIVAVVLGLTFGAGYRQGIKHQSNTTEQAEARAYVAKVEADAFKRQATALIETEKADKARIASADATTETLRRRLADIQNRRPDASAPASAPSEPSHTVIASGTPEEWATLRNLVEAQNAQVKTRDALILTVTASRDYLKASLEAREVENLNLRAANAAKDGLIKGALWKGRIQGFAVGFAGGYATGRLQ